MPSTSPDIQEQIDRLLGCYDDIGQDHAAERFLFSHGWTEHPAQRWCWCMPSRYHVPTWDEVLCVIYLIEEWDFGGVVD